MDASAHKLHSLGITDTTADAPPSVRANVANAEATAVVERLLGLRMAQINAPRDVVIQRIEDRVFSIVDEARASINRADLRTALDNNLNNALQQIRPELNFDNANERERTQAIAQAVYESVPSDLIHQISVMSASANFALVDGRQSSIVEIAGAPVNGVDPVRINLDHSFWRQQDFRSPAEIIAALTGSRGAEVGLLPARTRNHRVTAAEAAAIVAQDFNVVSIAPVNRPNRTVNAVPTTPVGATAFDFTVRMDALMRGVTTADAPAGLQNRRIAELTSAQIQTLLEYRGTAGNFPYWTQFVEPSNGHNPDQQVNVGGTISSLSDVAASEIRTGTTGAVLGERSITLLDAHTDVRAEHTRLQNLMNRLMTGSENQAGAAVALSLAASNPNVMNVATQQVQEARVLADLNRARARLELSAQLRNLSEMNLNFKFQTMPLGTAATLDTIIAEETALRVDISNIGSGGRWTSEFCTNAGFALPSTFTTPDQRRDMATAIQAQLREVTEERGRYNQLLNALRRVTQAAVTSETFAGSPRLNALMTAAGNPVPGAITANTNNVADAVTIRNETRLPTDADITADITRNEGLLQRARAGGDTGDVLQQRIFQEHFRRQGLSNPEAEKSANYLYTRSLLDDELTTQHQVLIDDLFEAIDHGPEDTALQQQGTKSVRQIATTLGIPAATRITGTRNRTRVFGNGGFVVNEPENVTQSYYDWERTPYRTLVTAYFSFKKVFEGGGGDKLSAPGSHTVQNEMKRIAEVLSRRHATMLLNDMGNDLPDEDRRRLGSRKSLSAETLQHFLTGDAPEKYSVRIDQVLQATDHRMEKQSFWRTRPGRALSFTGNLAKSVPGVIGSAASRTLGTLNSAKNWTWSQRRNITTLALFTALGGPLGMAAWGAMKGLEGGGPAASSHSGH